MNYARLPGEAWKQGQWINFEAIPSHTASLWVLNKVKKYSPCKLCLRVIWMSSLERVMWVAFQAVEQGPLPGEARFVL